MEQDKIRLKLQKILRLAKEGVGGEKLNAQSILTKLLAKYHLTLEDIENKDNEETKINFIVKNKDEFSLLRQVAVKVVNSLNIKCTVPFRKKCSMYVEKRFAAQIVFEYEIYLMEYKKEIKKLKDKQKKERDNLFSAFVQVNALYRTNITEDELRNIQIPSKEDLRDIFKMVDEMNPVSVNKAIESK